jgi:hypothetical protein
MHAFGCALQPEVDRYWGKASSACARLPSQKPAAFSPWRPWVLPLLGVLSLYWPGIRRFAGIAGDRLPAGPNKMPPFGSGRLGPSAPRVGMPNVHGSWNSSERPVYRVSGRWFRADLNGCSGARSAGRHTSMRLCHTGHDGRAPIGNQRQEVDGRRIGTHYFPAIELTAAGGSVLPDGWHYSAIIPRAPFVNE